MNPYGIAFGYYKMFIWLQFVEHPLNVGMRPIKNFIEIKITLFCIQVHRETQWKWLPKLRTFANILVDQNLHLSITYVLDISYINIQTHELNIPSNLRVL